MSSPGAKSRALLVPIQTQGHWSPFMNIIQRLVDHEVALTLCVSQDRADEMKEYAANGDLEGADVEVVIVFSGAKTDRLSPGLGYRMCNELKTNMARLKPGRFSCIIFDTMLGVCKDIANNLGIPHYGLMTNASHFGLVFLQAEALAMGGWFDNDPETDDRLLDVPGLEVFSMKELNFLWEGKEFLRSRSKRLGKIHLLLNTFEELEQNSLGVLRSLMGSTSGNVPVKVFTIGPLPLFPTLPSFEKHGQKGAEGEYVEWLDKKPKSSVLYICFGSCSEVGPSAGMAVAKALESTTQVSFLWALRLPPGARKEDVLPEGFETRTHGRGLVVTSWVSQQDVLLHPSTDAFLSHCGWNSCLESISAGVPIITHPLDIDQQMNARHMVTRLRVAVEIKHEKGHGKGEYTCEAITEAIQTLMVKEEGEHIRNNMLNLQQAALKAAAEGGSSHRYFQDLANDIKQLQTQSVS